jgi:hypothetical protein
MCCSDSVPGADEHLQHGDEPESQHRGDDRHCLLDAGSVAQQQTQQQKRSSVLFGLQTTNGVPSQGIIKEKVAQFFFLGGGDLSRS